MSFDDVEADFHGALSESLSPRGFDLLYDLVAAMNLPAGAKAVDVGCGRGTYTRELAEPSFVVGRVEELPLADASMDLEWCRDMLSLVDNLPRAFGEMHRVLRPRGRALVYVTHRAVRP